MAVPNSSCCFLFAVVILILNLSSSTNALPTAVDNRAIIHPIDEDYSCFDAFLTPHESLIPHPSDCTRFFICTLDAKHIPQPIPHYCQDGQIFNFDTCWCDWPWNVQYCYNSENEEHEKNYFKCACPMLNGEGPHVENEWCHTVRNDSFHQY